jgi:hypothetical protein
VTGAWRSFLDAVAGRADDPPALPEHLRPKGCAACGLIFSSHGAYDCHVEPMPGGGGRCMPASRFEGSLLTERDGVWRLSGFER